MTLICSCFDFVTVGLPRFQVEYCLFVGIFYKHLVYMVSKASPYNKIVAPFNSLSSWYSVLIPDIADKEW